MKKFKDMRRGDKLYILKPFTREILETEVTESAVHPKSLTKKVWVLNFFKIVLGVQITQDTLNAARKHETPNILTQLFVPADADWALISKPIPTPVFTDRYALEKWINNPRKDITLLLKEIEMERAKPSISDLRLNKPQA